MWWRSWFERVIDRIRQRIAHEAHWKLERRIEWRARLVIIRRDLGRRIGRLHYDKWRRQQRGWIMRNPR
jgi:hypothetical protein